MPIDSYNNELKPGDIVVYDGRVSIVTKIVDHKVFLCAATLSPEDKYGYYKTNITKSVWQTVKLEHVPHTLPPLVMQRLITKQLEVLNGT